MTTEAKQGQLPTDVAARQEAGVAGRQEAGVAGRKEAGEAHNADGSFLSQDGKRT